MSFIKSLISSVGNLFSGSQSTAKAVVKSAPSIIEAGSPNIIKTAVKSGSNAVSSVSGGRSIAKTTANAIAKTAGGSPSIFKKTIKGSIAGAGLLALTAGGISIGDYARGVITKTDEQIEYEQKVKTAEDEYNLLIKLKELYGDGWALMFDGGSSGNNILPVLRSTNESQANQTKAEVSGNEATKWIVGGVVALAGLGVGSYVYSKIKRKK